MAHTTFSNSPGDGGHSRVAETSAAKEPKISIHISTTKRKKDSISTESASPALVTIPARPSSPSRRLLPRRRICPEGGRHHVHPAVGEDDLQRSHFVDCVSNEEPMSKSHPPKGAGEPEPREVKRAEERSRGLPSLCQSSRPWRDPHRPQRGPSQLSAHPCWRQRLCWKPSPPRSNQHRPRSTIC